MLHKATVLSCDEDCYVFLETVLMFYMYRASVSRVDEALCDLQEKRSFANKQDARQKSTRM